MGASKPSPGSGNSMTSSSESMIPPLLCLDPPPLATPLPLPLPLPIATFIPRLDLPASPLLLEPLPLPLPLARTLTWSVRALFELGPARGAIGLSSSVPIVSPLLLIPMSIPEPLAVPTPTSIPILFDELSPLNPSIIIGGVDEPSVKGFGVDAPEIDGVVGPTVRKFVPGTNFRRTLRGSRKSGEVDINPRRDGPASAGDAERREDLRRGREWRGTLNDDGEEITVGICVRPSDSRLV